MSELLRAENIAKSYVAGGAFGGGERIAVLKKEDNCGIKEGKELRHSRR